jgi:hypothetical protein
MRIALPVKFPDHQGKYRDFRDLNVRETTCSRKSHAFSAVLVRIPYSTEQGNIFQE